MSDIKVKMSATQLSTVIDTDEPLTLLKLPNKPLYDGKTSVIFEKRLESSKIRYSRMGRSMKEPVPTPFSSSTCFDPVPSVEYSKVVLSNGD